MIEETEKSRKAKKAQIGLDRPKPMTDLDDLDHYLVHVAELEAEIEGLRAALKRLMDQPTMHPLAMTPDQRKELWAAHEDARAALEPKP